MEDFETPREDPVDQDIEYARSKRKAVINHLTEKGVPDDDGRIALLLGALNDMDRTSLGRKKIKAESDTAANNRQAADLIASIFMLPDSKKLGMAAIDGALGTVPSSDGKLPEVEILPGEMDINPAPLDYESFMSRQPNGSV